MTEDSLWDPMWEYFLDDYDEESAGDETRRTNVSGRKNQRGKSSLSKQSSSTKYRDSREDFSSQRNNTGGARRTVASNRVGSGSGRRLSWRKRRNEHKSVENISGEESTAHGSFLNVFQDPREAAARKEARSTHPGTRGSTNDSRLAMHKNNPTSASSGVENGSGPSNSRLANKKSIDSEDSKMSSTSRTKKRFSNPFRKNRSWSKKTAKSTSIAESTSDIDPTESRTVDSDPRLSSQDTQPRCQTRAKATIPTSPSARTSVPDKKDGGKKSSKSGSDGDFFDPFAMIFGSGDMFDGWGTSESEVDETDDDFSDLETIHTEGTQDKPSSNRGTEPQSYTEIRIKHNPRAFQLEQQQEPVRFNTPVVPLSETHRLGERKIFVQPHDSYAGARNPYHASYLPSGPESALASNERQSSDASEATPYDEAADDISSIGASITASSGPRLGMEISGNKKTDTIPVRKIVCWSPKAAAALDRGNVVSHTDKHIHSGADDVSQMSTTVNSVISHAKPDSHSVYEYDYDSGEHTSTIYTAFGNDPISSISIWKYAAPPTLDEHSSCNQVIVRVDASTVSRTDCEVRKGNIESYNSDLSFPRTPGVDMAGKVYQVPFESGKRRLCPYHPGDAVLSLLPPHRRGGNTRFVRVDANQLVMVPSNVDLTMACCLPETYLSAFQALHFGQTGAHRYRANSLKGKTILILGAMSSSMGRAMIELATYASTACIYATAKKKHWKTLVSLGVMPLSLNIEEWLLRLEGRVDLVLATNSKNREDVTTSHLGVLKPHDGHIILCGTRNGGNDMEMGEWKPHGAAPGSIVCARNKSMVKRQRCTHSYNVFQQWENDLQTCRQDLVHLLQLLAQKNIEPNVLDRIPLEKVPRAQRLLENKRLSGFIVCEPWLKTKAQALYL